MTAMRLEEQKQKRLERTKVLKMILSKKLGAKKLRRMMLMMEQLTMEDLEMEVEEVEAKVAELMEIGDEYSDPKYDDEPNKMELSNQEGDVEEMASRMDEDRLLRKMSLEPVKNTTIVESGGIQGVGENNYVPFFNVSPDVKYPDGMPDGVEYPENTANINIFEPRSAHSVTRNSKRKRESGIMMDYERVRATKRNRVDCQ